MYKGYQKIPETTTEWKQNENIKNVKNWYITEKVHGSCFCIIYENLSETIKYAKRKALLNNNETFFGYKTILSQLESKVNQIAKKLNTKHKDLMQINIYGELFGGGDKTPIQSGIFYSDNIHFYAFDISYLKNNTDEIYLDFEESIILFENSNMFYAKPIAKFNCLEKALDFDYNFQSTIFKRLHPNKELNLLLTNNNKAEGVVVRSGTKRFLIKLKIQEFSETRYDDNNYQREKSSNLDNYKNFALKCLTINRLNNAQSKYGEFEKYKDAICEELCMDILVEINGFGIYELKTWLDEEILKKIESIKSQKS